MIVYKVVIRRGNGMRPATLISAWAQGEWVEEYVPNEMTYPLHGKTGLFAFANEEGALAWCHGKLDMVSPLIAWEVWEAEAESPTPVPDLIPSIRNASIEFVLTWWKAWRTGSVGHYKLSAGQYRAMQHWSKASFWCAGIRLTKQLHVRF